MPVSALVIVFSKDRALQLDACLRSFLRHVTIGERTALRVIYSTSSDRHERQYRELARAFSDSAILVREPPFRERLLEALTMASTPAQKPRPPFWRLLGLESGIKTPESWDEPCVLWLVDDAIFVRTFDLETTRRALLRTPAALGVSLRLGRNTTRSYVLDRPQNLPKTTEADSAMLKYKWARADGDFGYPLEVSSSIYRLGTVLQLLQELDFEDPNSLESQMSLQAGRFRRSHPFLLCFDTSVAFSVPANRVQSVYSNRSGKDPKLSLEALTRRFEAGERIDIASLDGLVPASCHQEVAFRFRRQTEIG